MPCILSTQAKSQFKSRSIANNVEIIIPVPNDVDSPTFKASIGSVAYLPDQVRWLPCPLVQSEILTVYFCTWYMVVCLSYRIP